MVNYSAYKHINTVYISYCVRGFFIFSSLHISMWLGWQTSPADRKHIRLHHYYSAKNHSEFCINLLNHYELSIPSAKVSVCDLGPSWSFQANQQYLKNLTVFSCGRSLLSLRRFTVLERTYYCVVRMHDPLEPFVTVDGLRLDHINEFSKVVQQAATPSVHFAPAAYQGDWLCFSFKIETDPYFKTP